MSQPSFDLTLVDNDFSLEEDTSAFDFLEEELRDIGEDDIDFGKFEDINIGEDKVGLGDINQEDLDQFIQEQFGEIKVENRDTSVVSDNNDGSTINKMFENQLLASLNTRDNFKISHAKEMNKLLTTFTDQTKPTYDPSASLVILDFINEKGQRTMIYPYKMNNDLFDRGIINYLYFDKMRVINKLERLPDNKPPILTFNVPKNEDRLDPSQLLSSYDHINLMNYSFLKLHERIFETFIKPKKTENNITSGGSTKKKSEEKKLDIDGTIFRGFTNFIRDGVTNLDMFRHLKFIGFTSEDYSIQIFNNMKEGKLTNYFSLNADVIESDLRNAIINHGLSDQKNESDKETFIEKTQMFSKLYPNSLGLYNIFEDYLKSNIWDIFNYHFNEFKKKNENTVEYIKKEIVPKSGNFTNILMRPPKEPAKNASNRTEEMKKYKKSLDNLAYYSETLLTFYSEYISAVYDFVFSILKKIKSPFYQYIFVSCQLMGQSTKLNTDEHGKGIESDSSKKKYLRFPLRDHNLSMIYQYMKHTWENTSNISLYKYRQPQSSNTIDDDELVDITPTNISYGMYNTLNSQITDMFEKSLSKNTSGKDRINGYLPTVFLLYTSHKLVDRFLKVANGGIMSFGDYEAISFEEFKNIYESSTNEYKKYHLPDSNKTSTNQTKTIPSNSLWFFMNQPAISSGSTWLDIRPRNYFKIISNLPNIKTPNSNDKQYNIIGMIDILKLLLKNKVNASKLAQILSKRILKNTKTFYSGNDFYLKSYTSMTMIPDVSRYFATQYGFSPLYMNKEIIGLGFKNLNLYTNDDKKLFEYFVMSSKSYRAKNKKYLIEILEEKDKKFKNETCLELDDIQKQKSSRGKYVLLNWCDVILLIDDIKKHINSHIEGLITSYKIVDIDKQEPRALEADELDGLRGSFKNNIGITIKSLTSFIAFIITNDNFDNITDELKKKYKEWTWYDTLKSVRDNREDISRKSKSIDSRFVLDIIEILLDQSGKYLYSDEELVELKKSSHVFYKNMELSQHNLIYWILNVMNKQMTRSVTNFLWKLQQIENGTFTLRYKRKKYQITQERRINNVPWEYDSNRYGKCHDTNIIRNFLMSKKDYNDIKLGIDLSFTELNNVFIGLNHIIFNRYGWSIEHDSYFQNISKETTTTTTTTTTDDIQQEYKKYLEKKIRKNDSYNDKNIENILSSETDPLNLLYYVLMTLVLARYYNLIMLRHELTNDVSIDTDDIVIKMKSSIGFWSDEVKRIKSSFVMDDWSLKDPLGNLKYIMDNSDYIINTIQMNNGLNDTKKISSTAAASFMLHNKYMNRNVLMGLIQLVFIQHSGEVPNSLKFPGNHIQEAVHYLTLIFSEYDFTINGLGVFKSSKFRGELHNKTTNGLTYGFNSDIFDVIEQENSNGLFDDSEMIVEEVEEITMGEEDPIVHTDNKAVYNSENDNIVKLLDFWSWNFENTSKINGDDDNSVKTTPVNTQKTILTDVIGFKEARVSNSTSLSTTSMYDTVTSDVNHFYTIKKVLTSNDNWLVSGEAGGYQSIHTEPEIYTNKENLLDFVGQYSRLYKDDDRRLEDIENMSEEFKSNSGMSRLMNEISKHFLTSIFKNYRMNVIRSELYYLCNAFVHLKYTPSGGMDQYAIVDSSNKITSIKRMDNISHWTQSHPLFSTQGINSLVDISVYLKKMITKMDMFIVANQDQINEIQKIVLGLEHNMMNLHKYYSYIIRDILSHNIVKFPRSHTESIPSFIMTNLESKYTIAKTSFGSWINRSYFPGNNTYGSQRSNMYEILGANMNKKEISDMITFDFVSVVFDKLVIANDTSGINGHTNTSNSKRKLNSSSSSSLVLKRKK